MLSWQKCMTQSFSSNFPETSLDFFLKYLEQLQHHKQKLIHKKLIFKVSEYRSDTIDYTELTDLAVNFCGLRMLIFMWQGKM